MTTTHPHSAVIEQMRRQRASPTSVRDGDATPSLRRLETASTIGLAAGLRQRNAAGRLARLLGNDDPDEVTAVLDELASLLARIGYHWRSTLASKHSETGVPSDDPVHRCNRRGSAVAPVAP
ncbi:MAG: hypothetical protein IPH55_16580 [Betaproteobacteria bacterium]|nr:hypothetical protein [Betaproteobacteria bacterium]